MEIASNSVKGPIKKFAPWVFAGLLLTEVGGMAVRSFKNTPPKPQTDPNVSCTIQVDTQKVDPYEYKAMSDSIHNQISHDINKTDSVYSSMDSYPNEVKVALYSIRNYISQNINDNESYSVMSKNKAEKIKILNEIVERVEKIYN